MNGIQDDGCDAVVVAAEARASDNRVICTTEGVPIDVSRDHECGFGIGEHRDHNRVVQGFLPKLRKCRVFKDYG